MQVQNCTKHSPARQGEECPKCQIDHLRAVNAELLEALVYARRMLVRDKSDYDVEYIDSAIAKHRG